MTIPPLKLLKDIKFEFINKLLYYIRVNNKQYLYIFNILKNKIFHLIYNN